MPCSGSGAWRRSPEGKWRLTQDDLKALLTVQAEILETTKERVTPNGVLAYATCSVLPDENSKQVSQFLNRNPNWRLQEQKQFLPDDGGDGFFVATFKKS